MVRIFILAVFLISCNSKYEKVITIDSARHGYEIERLNAISLTQKYGINISIDSVIKTRIKFSNPPAIEDYFKSTATLLLLEDSLIRKSSLIFKN